MTNDYSYELLNPGEQSLEIDNEAIDILIKRGKTEYAGTLITLKYLIGLFDKNQKTGESAGGSYFCMPRMVVVKDISEKTIKKTLDDLIERDRFDTYFK